MNSENSIAHFKRVQDAWIYPGQSENDLKLLASKFYLTYEVLVSLI